MKVVAITGGSRGIGKSMGDLFKHHGWNVASCSINSVTERCDVSDPKDVKAWIAKIVERWKKIDVLINNAGIAGANSLEPGESDDLWNRILDVNLSGAYYVSKAALPYLPDGGRIINIASVLALKGIHDQTAYCAAKHGIVGFTKALSRYLAPRKITVNAICPGWVRTDMATMRMKELALSEKDAIAAIPLGRIVEPGEVAELALYLASPQAASITGQTLTIDGGALA